MSKSGKLALIWGKGIAENPRELRKRREMIIDIKNLCDEIGENRRMKRFTLVLGVQKMITLLPSWIQNWKCFM